MWSFSQLNDIQVSVRYKILNGFVQSCPCLLVQNINARTGVNVHTRRCSTVGSSEEIGPGHSEARILSQGSVIMTLIESVVFIINIKITLINVYLSVSMLQLFVIVRHLCTGYFKMYSHMSVTRPFHVSETSSVSVMDNIISLSLIVCDYKSVTLPP